MGSIWHFLLSEAGPLIAAACGFCQDNVPTVLFVEKHLESLYICQKVSGEKVRWEDYMMKIQD